MANLSVSAIDIEENLRRQRVYEETYQSSADPWGYASYADDVRFRTIANTARKWCPTSHRSLDVACGLGQLTVLLHSFSKQVFAYDFSPSAVERTRERCEQFQCNGVQVEVRDATDPKYEANYFDLILMSDMDISGNPDWWRHVLATHRALLTKNGFLIASGRVRPSGRERFDRNFDSLGGTIVDRIFFHDRYWFKARSVVRRVMPKRWSNRVLGQAWLFRTTQSIGRLVGPVGSIHYGVVVRFS